MKRYEIYAILSELEKRRYAVERKDGAYSVRGERGIIKFDKFDGRDGPVARASAAKAE